MNYLFYSYNDRCYRIQCFFYVALIILIFSGCDESSHSPIEAGGSVAFQLQWMDDEAVGIEAVDCDKASVSNVNAIIYNEHDDPIATGGPWAFEDHKGRISDVQPGPNNTIVVMGSNPVCDSGIVYRGEVGVDITAGQVNDAGIIEMYRFVPASESLTNNTDYDAETLTLSWKPVSGAYSYRFQTADYYDPNFENPEIDAFVSASLYYFGDWYAQIHWRVQAIDSFDNVGAWSNSKMWDY